MPIQMTKIDKTRLISVPETATLAEALAKLVKAGGDDQWWLQIEKSNGSHTAMQFAAYDKLVDKYGPALFDTPLSQLPVDTVRGTSIEFAASSLVQLYGEYVKLSDDARSAWKPSGKEPPVHPLCGHKAWPELDSQGRWVCGQCKMLIPQG